MLNNLQKTRLGAFALAEKIMIFSCENCRLRILVATKVSYNTLRFKNGVALLINHNLMKDVCSKIIIHRRVSIKLKQYIEALFRYNLLPISLIPQSFFSTFLLLFSSFSLSFCFFFASETRFSLETVTMTRNIFQLLQPIHVTIFENTDLRGFEKKQ